MRKFQSVARWALKRRGMTSGPATFARYLRHGVIWGLALPVIVIAAYFGSGALVDMGVLKQTVVTYHDPSHKPKSDFKVETEDPAKAKVRAMFDSGECWTDGDHGLPSRVVIDYHVYGPEMTGKAMDAMFGGKHNGIDVSKVNGYCR